MLDDIVVAGGEKNQGVKPDKNDKIFYIQPNGVINGKPRNSPMFDKDTTSYQLSDGVALDNDTNDDNEKSSCNSLESFYEEHKPLLILCVKVILLVAYLVFVVYSFTVRFGDEGSIRLLVCTAFGVLLLSWRTFKKSKYRSIISKMKPNCSESSEKKLRKIVQWVLYIIAGGMAIFYTVKYSIIDHPENLISLGGILIFVAGMFVTSTNRHKIKWHTIYWGFMVQFIMGVIFLRTDFGVSVMTYIRVRFTELLAYSDTGAAFVFSDKFKDFQFIFQSMPRVLFFVTLINVLQYLGVMAFLIKNVGGLLAFCLGTKPVESIVAASNIIMGSNESFMIVRPYLDTISRPQIFCLLVAGMSSVAGSAMIVFQSFGVSMEHLLTASVMSAPASLLCAKLSMPEEEDDEKLPTNNNEKEGKIQIKDTSGSRNVLEALTKGAQMATMLVSSIVVTMILYLSLTEFLNATLRWFGERVDVEDFTFEFACSYLLWPLAFIIGIPSEDCFVVARLLGVRALTNAGLAYIDMGKYINNKEQLTSYELLYNDTTPAGDDLFLPQWNTTLSGGVLQDRTEIIGTYALCGFACVPVLGITMGVMGTLAPKRLNDVTQCVFRAFIISSIASYITGCIAGLLYTGRYN